MKNIVCWSTTIFPLILFFTLSGCSVQNNSEAITKRSAFSKTIERAKRDKRYFIMYSGKDSFSITSIMVENRKREVTVQLDRIDSIHKAAITNPAASPEKEIFLYMQDSVSYTLDEPHTIPLTKVRRIELSE